jgi:hypothetical protein
MVAKKDDSNKTCFVIAPIGKEGSDVRIRSDQVLKHIISPVARECGYDPIRADQISEPGLITSQIIQHVVDDALVIADLTGWNPNVFYELAVRHAVKKPTVQIINATETMPFDVAATRTIQVDHHDLDSAARAREEIGRQIKAVERNPSEVDTPISVAVELQSLRQSDNPLEKSNAEIMSMLQELRVGLAEIKDTPRLNPRAIEEMAMMFHRLGRLMEVEDGKELTLERLADMREHLMISERAFEHVCMSIGFPYRFRHARFADRPKPADK